MNAARVAWNQTDRIRGAGLRPAEVITPCAPPVRAAHRYAKDGDPRRPAQCV